MTSQEERDTPAQMKTATEEEKRDIIDHTLHPVIETEEETKRESETTLALLKGIIKEEDPQAPLEEEAPLTEKRRNLLKEINLIKDIKA